MRKIWTPAAVGVVLCLGSLALAHPHTFSAHQKQRQAADTRAAQFAEAAPADDEPGAVCLLTIDLIDASTGQSLPGLVRVTNMATGKAVELRGTIKREANWYSVPARVEVAVPRSMIKVEALHGIEMERGLSAVDLAGKEQAAIEIPLQRFYDARENGLRSGNTHVHLMNLTHEEAFRYLQIVPKSDDLDLVYLSYLRRAQAERTYISNQMVAGSLGGGGDLARLSAEGVLFATGEEHRHNFGPGGEGYGHVMFLDLLKLIEPISIGPGIMQDGTDGLPLRRGIQSARADGAAVIWCHNRFGFEDIPNWVAGLLDAQNIFDGGVHGSYEDTFYRYLNLGLKVPFSTGTDWFIYDFSRVYVPVEGELTSKKWLASLVGGKSFITNGPLLEFSVSGRQPGDTVAITESSRLEIDAHGWGRCHFAGLELIHNGRVVKTAPCQRTQGHYKSEMKLTLDANEPGWLALRIPLDAGKNEFDKPLYAHTSPVYVQVAGERIFRPQIAQELIDEIKDNMQTIQSKGRFDSEAERESVLEVHRDGIAILQKWLAEKRSQD